MKYEKADLWIGIAIVVVGAAALMGVTAAAFAGTHGAGNFSDSAGLAHGIAAYAGHFAGVVFAIALLDASVIGAFAVSLSSAYAIGDVLGLNHSLHRGVGQAKGFYAVYAALVGGAAAIVLLPGSPLGLITEGVQVLAGVLLPSATVFLLLLCNDKAVLGPWTNPGWLNAVAAFIVGVLVILSAILTVTVLFPDVNVTTLTEALFGVLFAGLLTAGPYAVRGQVGRRLDIPSGAHAPEVPRIVREHWTMPQLELLDKPTWTRTRKVWMLALRGYLVLAMTMLIVKAIEIGIGH
jgi:hypothetical protein